MLLIPARTWAEASSWRLGDAVSELVQLRTAIWNQPESPLDFSSRAIHEPDIKRVQAKQFGVNGFLACGPDHLNPPGEVAVHTASNILGRLSAVQFWENWQQAMLSGDHAFVETIYDAQKRSVPKAFRSDVEISFRRLIGIARTSQLVDLHIPGIQRLLPDQACYKVSE